MYSGVILVNQSPVDVMFGSGGVWCAAGETPVWVHCKYTISEELGPHSYRYLTSHTHLTSSVTSLRECIGTFSWRSVLPLLSASLPLSESPSTFLSPSDPPSTPLSEKDYPSSSLSVSQSPCHSIRFKFSERVSIASLPVSDCPLVSLPVSDFPLLWVTVSLSVPQ